MGSFFDSLGKLKYPIVIALAILVGIGMYTAYEARVWSYASSSPETCINCHVMTSEYVSWRRSSHGRFSTCVDCHLPQQNIVKKMAYKAIDGMVHTAVFTAHAEPQAITISPMGKKAVQENCKRCHESLVHDIGLLGHDNDDYEKGEKRCWDCHRHVPHGTVKSLSSTPNAGIGIGPADRVPEWIKEHSKNNK
ncbi:MAG: cytochrome c nitrite reductase small subunit [Fibrobacterales bacterium]